MIKYIYIYIIYSTCSFSYSYKHDDKIYVNKVISYDYYHIIVYIHTYKKRQYYKPPANFMPFVVRLATHVSRSSTHSPMWLRAGIWTLGDFSGSKQYICNQ